MNVRIKRIDTSLPLPEYQTKGAVAFDMYSRIPETLEPGETKLVPTNLIIKTPPGYMLMLAARSSLAKKKGLKMANSIGIIDQDYCGDKDELLLCLHNYSASPVTLEPGERLAQGTFVPIQRAQWQEVESMDHSSRGGFGTTGS